MHGLTRHGAFRSVVVAFMLLASTAACGNKDNGNAVNDSAAGSTATTSLPVTVTSVRLGEAIDANKRVTDESDDFDPTDTIYASVLTTGSSQSASIQAVWTFEDGQVVDSTTQTIAPTGDAVTEFHISKPDGFPKGKYKLVVRLNGTEAGTKEFKID